MTKVDGHESKPGEQNLPAEINYKDRIYMKRIEDIIVDIIFDWVNVILQKTVHPDIRLADVTQLTEAEIIRLKETLGIEGVILDVDKTLRTNLNCIPKCNQEWIDTVRKHLKIIIVSNGKDTSIAEFFEERGIEYISLAFKPLSFGFKKACKKMELNPEKVLVVGDDLFDDIYGGKRLKMKTAIIENVIEDEEIQK